MKQIGTQIKVTHGVLTGCTGEIIGIEHCETAPDVYNVRLIVGRGGMVTTDSPRWVAITEAAKAAREIDMFGCTQAENEAGFAAMMQQDKPMQAISVLSDVQELITLGEDEKARQYINRVKWLLTTI